MEDQKDQKGIKIEDQKLDLSNESQSKKESKGDEGSSNGSSFKSQLYSWNPNKSQRGGLRRKRDSYIKRILSLNEKKDIKGRNELMIEFNEEFYQKNYLLNDFSLGSLGFKNMGIDSRENLENFLSISRRWKIKK